MIETCKASGSAVDEPTAILMALREKLDKADLRKVVLRKQITPKQAHRRVNADGFRINGDFYIKPDRLRQWVPNHRNRIVLKDSGVLRTRRNDVDTIEQVIAGIAGVNRRPILTPLSDESGR